MGKWAKTTQLPQIQSERGNTYEKKLLFLYIDATAMNICLNKNSS